MILPQKSKHRTNKGPAIPVLDKYIKGFKAGTQITTCIVCMSVFPAASFAVVKKWKEYNVH